MTHKTPQFWYQKIGVKALLLSPFSAVYAIGNWIDRLTTRPKAVGIPVIAVGNLVAGGGGKTPTTIALIQMLKSLGYEPHIVSRGYGRSRNDLLRVDTAEHSAAEVGDEPLLLARYAPCWVHANRYRAARAAEQAGATLIIMDDGLQHKYLLQDAGVLCVSAEDGFGNGLLLPAGPKRQTLRSLLPRVDMVLTIGTPSERSQEQLKDLSPRYSARLLPQDWQVKDVSVVALTGIARPERFFAMLEEQGAILQACHAYGDHHPFSEAELDALQDEARANNALLVTTAKDHARLPAHWKSRVRALEVQLTIPEKGAMTEQLQETLTSHYNGREK